MSETKIQVTYSYLTDVWQSYDGQEQRRCLRSVPRRTISYEYTSMNSSEAQWLRAQLRKKQNNFEFIPMWHDVAYLSEDFLGGKSMYIDPEYMIGFHNCDTIEIFAHDDVMHHEGINITKKVKKYENNIIHLKTVLDKKLNKKNTWILPLIRCSVQTPLSSSYIYSNGTNIKMIYEDIGYKPTFDINSQYYEQYNYLVDGFNRYNLPPSYNGRQVFLNTPQWLDDDSLTLKVSKNVNKLDNDTGIFKYDLKNTNSYDTHEITVLLRNKRMINNIIKFFTKVKGQFKSFYCPSWANDFNLAQSIKKGSNYIYTDLSEMYRYYMENGRNKKIVVFTNDWKSYIFDISAYAYEKIEDKKCGKLLLGSSSPVNIPIKNVRMVSFFNLVRFDSDEMQINYESNIAATVQLSMKEVDDA